MPDDENRVIILCCCVHCHLCINPFTARELDIGHQVEDEFLSVSFRQSTTSLPCLSALIPLPIIILKDFNNIDNKYKAAEHI